MCIFRNYKDKQKRHSVQELIPFRPIFSSIMWLRTANVSLCCPIFQAQHGAGMAATVAVLWPVSTQSVSSEAHSSVSGVAPPRAARLGLSAADAELAEVSPVCSVMCLTTCTDVGNEECSPLLSAGEKLMLNIHNQKVVVKTHSKITNCIYIYSIYTHTCVYACIYRSEFT